MLSVIYAECRKQAHDAECHYAECRYAECRGAVNRIYNNCTCVNFLWYLSRLSELNFSLVIFQNKLVRSTLSKLFRPSLIFSSKAASPDKI